MSDHAATRKSPHKVEEHLQQIAKLLEKHRLVETLVDRDRTSPRHDLIESLIHRQHLVELQLKLRSLHPADIAYILEALPLDDRLLIWRQIEDAHGGEVLLEVSEAVRDSLIEALEEPALIKVLSQLDADDPLAEAQHLRVVGQHRAFDREAVVGGDCADTGHLVCADGHAEAGAADQQCPVGASVGDHAGRGDRDVRVGGVFVGSDPHVDH